MRQTHPTIARILVIRFSSAGDIVLASPMLRALRAAYVDATIDFLTLDDYADLVSHSPHVDTVRTIERSWGLHRLRSFRHDVLKGEAPYDVVIDIHCSLRSRIVRRGLAPRVLTIRKPTIRKQLLVVFGINRMRPIRPIPIRYLDAVRALGVNDDGGGLELHVGPTRSPLVADESRPTWMLCPGARHATKAWPAELFASLARVLVREGGRVVLLGGTAERGVCDEVVVMSGVAHGIVNLAGETTLLEAAATIDLADAVVANDSALAHIALARGRPTVVLFGSTVQEFGFGPFRGRSVVVERMDVDCRPCSTVGRDGCPRKHFACMSGIPVNDVVRAVEFVRGLHE